MDAKLSEKIRAVIIKNITVSIFVACYTVQYITTVLLDPIPFHFTQIVLWKVHSLVVPLTTNLTKQHQFLLK